MYSEELEEIIESCSGNGCSSCVYENMCHRSHDDTMINHTGYVDYGGYKDD